MMTQPRTATPAQSDPHPSTLPPVSLPDRGLNRARLPAGNADYIYQAATVAAALLVLMSV